MHRRIGANTLQINRRVSRRIQRAKYTVRLLKQQRSLTEPMSSRKQRTQARNQPKQIGQGSRPSSRTGSIELPHIELLHSLSSQWAFAEGRTARRNQIDRSSRRTTVMTDAGNGNIGCLTEAETPYLHGHKQR
jgi:hypothetical protein